MGISLVKANIQCEDSEYNIKSSNCEEESTMQEMGIAFEIETNNLKQLYVCESVCVYALSKPWEMQAKKPQSINTKKKEKVIETQH